jgi:hypothetical protein
VLSSNLFPAIALVLAVVLLTLIVRAWLRRRRLTVERTVGAHHRALDGLARSASPESEQGVPAPTDGDPGWGPGVVLLDTAPVKARHPARPRPDAPAQPGRTHVRLAAPGDDVSRAS